MDKLNLTPPIYKKEVLNSDKNLEWKIGGDNTNIVIENKRLNIKIKRQKIISSDNNKALYDTISIEEPDNSCIALIVDQFGKIGLIYEWRPIPEKWFWACVRGFGNIEDKNYLSAGKREALEEIGKFKILNTIDLGIIHSNTTFFEKSIGIVLLNVNSYEKNLDNLEGIKEFKFFTEKKIKSIHLEWYK